MQEHEAQSSSTAEITTGSAGQPEALIDLIRNDGFAMSFQSVRQYRETLLKTIRDAEQQPAPDVVGLVEALVMARGTIAGALRANAPDWFGTDEDIARHVGIKQIDKALASHCGQRGEL